MDKQESKKLDMRFKNIKVLKYSQFDLLEEFDKDVRPLVNFNSNFQFKVEPENNQITCVVMVQISILETGELFSELKVENVIEMTPLAEIIETSDGSHNVPNGILQLVVSLSISTVRGILSEKVKGTIMQDEIYPLIDPASLISNNV
ncbi:hypothetical protein G5B37_03375 [Rasiella rasia]|uniref:Uncharacterized protein n=1 Tax=Rasiella rasia TaxID=2744027 RepID=A0A6G6GJP0_9FLAO|nr:hypothetical protein [Rasiella rasia]QIE58633.1 hypothetical protein G5B37_03375 [Rasiella rasia]